MGKLRAQCYYVNVINSKKLIECLLGRRNFPMQVSFLVGQSKFIIDLANGKVHSKVNVLPCKDSKLYAWKLNSNFYYNLPIKLYYSY